MKPLPVWIAAAILVIGSQYVLWAQSRATADATGRDPVASKLPLVIMDSCESPSSSDCGLYCFLANAKCYGVHVDSSRLFSPKYLSGAFGSSVDDLVNCSLDFGFQAYSHRHMTIVDLWLLERPVLALIKNTLDGKVFNHWVLVVSVDANGVILLDPSAHDPSVGLSRVPVGEFMSVWGGISCVIMPEQGESWHYELVRFTSIAMKALGLFSVVLLYYFGQFTLAERFKWLLIPSLTIGLAIIYHTLLPVGFANNPQQLAVMTTSPQETVVVLKLEEWMANEAERSRCFLIDVRYPESFRRKHITGAVNIPVTSSDLAFLASLRNVAKDTPIVIYCQSEECPWSEMTARRRLFDAYRRVLVLEGGIEAYEGFLERRKAPARKENEP